MHRQRYHSCNTREGEKEDEDEEQEDEG